MEEVILAVKNVKKSFMGVQALIDVSFDLRAGEVHALVGENGAGKSTLMKILAGIHHKDAGKISYFDTDYEAKDARDPFLKGIGIIHQELNMMEDLTVAQNIFIGRESMKMKGLLLDDKQQNSKAEELFKQLNMDINPVDIVRNLSVGKQQMVEIAKAVSYDLKVLILDEPTAALTELEIGTLFKIIKELRNKGVGMIYISHRMDEIERISDRVTVLRDGRFIGTGKTDELSRQDIIHMMVGRSIYEKAKLKASAAKKAQVALAVRKLNAGELVKDISFDLHEGEILGFSGLMGAGRTELARAVFGADPIASGTIRVFGKLVKIKSPIAAIANQIAYLSEDRKRFGLAINLDVCDNTVMASYQDLNKGIFISSELISNVTRKYISKLKIKTSSMRQLVKKLSGGNQQKVVIAKWLLKNSKILIFDEPTRGIDVGAKSEIYTLMNELVESGKSIIIISSELPEILRMSDRIIVMKAGEIKAEIDVADANQKVIMQYST